MGCDVYVYDDQMNPLPLNTIEVIEADYGGTKIDLQPSTKQGPGEYGAKLKSPTPMEPITVVVDDTSGQYATTKLGALNPTNGLRLDVSLYPLPQPSGGFGTGSGGGGGGGGGGFTPSIRGFFDDDAQSPEEIVELIRKRVNSGDWTEREGGGVMKLVEVVIWALGCVALDPELEPRLDRWKKLLDDLGIQIAKKRSRGKPSGGQSGGAMQEREA